MTSARKEATPDHAIAAISVAVLRTAQPDCIGESRARRQKKARRDESSFKESFLVAVTPEQNEECLLHPVPVKTL